MKKLMQPLIKYIRRKPLITVYYESFEPEKFRGKLYTKTFAKRLSWTPCSYFLLIPYMNSAILNFHIKKFHGHTKSAKTVKLFCLKTFMVYGTSGARASSY